ncbi:universal stress protein [Fodinibius halophilus]|uniref:Universal stress protein n=1 Tax=Fodinibius halophilus TaxID=1736908 RepID=A0A6M1SW36_9BACT|nr:universal stress protein [Fodinibius halophilus]NGP87786.1 universal stress protein [Fodinibius halophilus]
MNNSFNHILFPTDFSKNANRALPFAAEIAHHAGAKLTLFHSTQESMDMLPSFEGSRDKTIQDTSDLFERLITDLRKKEAYADLDISTILQSGQPTTSLINRIEEEQPDLVVMGTKGVTGDRNAVFGSVASSVIKKSASPVLAIPNGCTLAQMEKIIFSTDYKSGDLGALKQTAGFAKLFNASVDVLHVSDHRNLESEIKHRGFRELVKEQITYPNINFHLTYEYDFFPGAADFLIEHPNSMLVMVRYKKTFWEKLTNRNHSKEMAFYSKVPLLVYEASTVKADELISV